MPERFLTIKEAAEEYGKAPITVRRLIREVVDNDSSKDRLFIQPNMDEVKELRQLSKPYTYSISTQLLDKAFREKDEKAAEEKKEGSESASSAATSKDIVLVDLLREELGVKNQQLGKQQETIDMLSNQLNERLKESNVLMKGLQDRLALPEPATPPVVEVVATTKKRAKPKTSSESAGKKRSTLAKPKPKKKPGFLRSFTGGWGKR